MAYDQFLVDRMSNFFDKKKVDYFSKNMMGGRVFMVNGKMCCGAHEDKKYGDNLIMARIGEAAYEKEIEKEVCLPMDFTGRPMRGYIFITPDGYDFDEDLEYWLQLALDFNPLAKASKKKAKKAPKKK